MYPMIWKSQVMRGKSGNLRANMYLFKATGDGASPNAVVMDTDGVAGSYNRANRSMHHFGENVPAFLATAFVASPIWPVPVFCLTVIYAIGRVMHQVGYSNKGYGGHGAGFGLATLAQLTLTGFCFLAFFLAL